MRRDNPHLATPRLGLVIVVFAAVSQAFVVSLASSAEEAVSHALDEKANPQVSWGIEADWNPRYIWRGLAYTNGPVMQKSAWATVGTMTYSLWMNTNLDRQDGRRTDEVDIGISHERESGAITLEPALWVYTFPGQEDVPTTAEIGIGLCAPMGSLQVVSNHYCEILQYPGAYFGDLGISLSKEIGDRACVEAGISLGWGSAKFNEANIGLRTSALNLLTVQISTTYYTCGSMYIRPHLEFTRILDSRLRRQIEDADILNLGVAAGMEF